MEVVGSSETSANFFQTTEHDIPNESSIHAIAMGTSNTGKLSG
jgi:hypothetical protein